MSRRAPSSTAAKASTSASRRPSASASTLSAPPVVEVADKRAQRRIDLAFNNAFAVVLSNPLLGESNCIARNVSCGGMFVECNDPFPLGSEVKIRFSLPRAWPAEGEGAATGREGPLPVEIVARGEVKNHYFINYADRGLGPRSVAGMGVRFLGFESGGDELLRTGLSRFRLH